MNGFLTLLYGAPRKKSSLFSFYFFLTLTGHLFFTNKGFAQLEPFFEEWRYVHFTVENGLPSNEILSIVETSDSIVWAATSKGLAYYDGYHFYPLDQSLGLPKGSVSFMSEGPNGKLLIIIGGLLFFGDRQGFIQIFLPEEFKAGKFIAAYTMVDQRIVCFVRQNANAALFRYENGVSKKLPVRSPLKIWKTDSRRIWISTESALFTLEQDHMLQVRIDDISYSQIDNIIENTKGEGFLSSRLPPEQVSIFQWKKESSIIKKQHEPEKTIRSLSISPNGEILLVNETSEMSFRQKDQWVKFRYIPSAMNKITFVQYRHNNDLWIGTENGLYLYRNRKEKWNHSAQSMLNSKSSVMEIYQTQQGDTWIGHGDGIEIQKSDGTIQAIRSINNKRLGLITGINQDNSGYVWISSGSSFEGSYRWDGTTWKYYGPAEGLGRGNFHKIKKDRDGNLWFLGLGSSAPDPGAFCLKDSTFERWDLKKGLIDNRVYAFAETKKGILWFGTNFGLCKYSNGHWENWRERSSHIFPKIYVLAVDKKNNVWFSNYNSNLGFIDTNDSVHIVWSELTGIGNRSQVWDIQCDENGIVWIAATSGLFCYQNGMITNYSAETGLTQNHLRSVLPTNTRIYVGGHNSGISVLEKRNISSPITIEFDRQNEGPDSVQIQWRTSSFWQTIKLHHIETRYKIDESAWSEWDHRREKTYYNLNNGIHHVIVQARDPFGISNVTENKMFFSTQPPFYLQTVYITTFSLLCVVIGITGARYVLMRKKHHKEIEKNRIQIANDLHDEIGSNLGAIALISQRLIRDKTLSDDTRQDLQTISHTSLETADFLRDIIWYTNPKHDTVNDLIDRLKEIAGLMLHGIELNFRDLGENHGINTSIEIRRHVFLIFKEILHNIIKHSNATRCEIVFTRNKNTFILAVVDNGIGFDLSTVKRGNGLNNLSTRSKEIGADLAVISTPGTGTFISVTFKNNVRA